jgi:hypothetical protein
MALVAARLQPMTHGAASNDAGPVTEEATSREPHQSSRSGRDGLRSRTRKRLVTRDHCVTRSRQPAPVLAPRNRPRDEVGARCAVRAVTPRHPSAGRVGRENGRHTPAVHPDSVDCVDELEDVSAGHRTASHVSDNGSRSLNPQVLGSNPRGRTFPQVRAFGAQAEMH